MIYARLIENKEPVGFYFAENLIDLFWCIDESVDPYSCEYTPVPLSGSDVVFHFTKPLKKEEEDGFSYWALENLEVGEGLQVFINDDEMLEGCEWFNFDGFRSERVKSVDETELEWALRMADEMTFHN